MSNDINDASVYDDNYTILSKIRKIMRQIKDLITRVTNLENAGGYVLPIASSSRLGGIKVGDNLSIREDGTLDAQAGGGGGGDVSGKLDTLYGQLYDPETGEFDRASLNDVEWNKDLVQAPDSGGSGTGDRKMQIPSMWALNQVYAEALNKGGGGGSSLTGEIKIYEGHFTKTAVSPTSGGIKSQYMVTSAETESISLNFVDIKKINSWPCSQSQTIQGIINIIDSSDTRNITIPQNYSIIGFEPERVYKSGNAVVNGAGACTTNLEGTLTLSFTDSGGALWSISGKGLLNLVWDYDGNIQVGNLNMEIATFYDSTNNKSYSGPQGAASTVSYWSQYSLTLDTRLLDILWDGYYVH